ncbi:hypothetical protein [Sphingomonas sp. R86520]|uniref:hypothetical protein n=1 Tax=Sphingomonas sp. R86520 TaxID=3093859 RepID=UPI0036D3DA83
MKIPGLGAIANLLLKRIVLPAIGKAIADPANPMTKQKVKDILVDAVEAEAGRQIGKRLGA